FPALLPGYAGDRYAHTALDAPLPSHRTLLAWQLHCRDVCRHVGRRDRHTAYLRPDLSGHLPDSPDHEYPDCAAAALLHPSRSPTVRRRTAGCSCRALLRLAGLAAALVYDRDYLVVRASS